MPSRPVFIRPLRRLVAVLLALSVLIPTLGWSHPSCDGPGTATEPLTSFAALPHDEARHEDGATTPGPARHDHSGCAEHQDQEGPADAARCALVAHCASAALGSTFVSPASRELLVVSSVALTVSRPLDAAYQPESPPPKS